MERRRFLRVMGGGFVLAAAGAAAAGAGLARMPEVPDEANAAWRTAGAAGELRRNILSYALLAPNPHNLQSWLVDLRADDAITLHVDLGRLLPQTDPFGRQILIGHGCFLETLSIAAAHFGRTADITLFPAGPFPASGPDARPVAHIVLREGAAPAPLFDAITRRRSVKEPFALDRVPSRAELAAIAAAAAPLTARAHADADIVTMVRDTMQAAQRIEMLTPRTMQESVDLMRIGRREIIAHRDGIDLGGGMMEALRALGLVSRAQLADPGSQAFAAGLVKYDELCQATPAVAWLTTTGNDRAAQIAAGRAYLRMALTATQLGLALHPMSQVLQEYPEMAELQRRFMADLRAPAGETVQMLVRVGHGPQVAAAPRRGLDAILRA